MPSFTFVSTAIAFIRQGAHIVFTDSYANNPNIDADSIEALITPKTKAIVVVHYAGIACDMEKILKIAEAHQLLVIEDAAQAIESFYTFSDGTKKALGSIGDMAAFSFHETKNIISGEGGLLAVNNEQFIHRAEIIWEKGTNRAEFFRGEVNKYGWVDIGSSFLPSEVTAAFLWAQLENIDLIQSKRIALWNEYYTHLSSCNENSIYSLPVQPSYASQNGHMFYILCKNLDARSELIKHLKSNDILAVFHYLSLHKSEYYKEKHDGRDLPHSDKFTDILLRLPMFYDLSLEDVERICNNIKTL
jgi:dTDP-4-amino-4,6-dideoxygalactose transaminase